MGVEVYDAFMDKFKPPSNLASGGRTACCLADWRSESKLVISGGEEWTGHNAQTIDSMIFSEYKTVPVVAPDSNDKIKELLDCQHLNVDTRDFSFKSVYNKFRRISDKNTDYHIFATHDQQAYLIIDANATQRTWIYNYTEKTSCYYYAENAGVVGLGPGIWIKPRTRYSQTKKILITFSCQTTMFSDDFHRKLMLWGLTEAAFITIVVVAALIIITALMVGFCCWWKKTQRFKGKYQYQYKQNKNTKNDEDVDDEDGEILYDEQPTNHKLFGYVKAKSYSSVNQINVNDAGKTITIIRHSTMDEDERVSFSESDSIELQPHHCKVARVQSDDDQSSSSTVNPHEVTFEATDKNTAMLDEIALEIKRQQKLQNTKQAQEQTLTIHRKDMMEPSRLNLAALNGRTPSIEPVAVNCPPPPPPVDATMLVAKGSHSTNGLNSYSEQSSILCDIYPANQLQQTHARGSVISVSKDNYAGHAIDHISCHDHEDRMDD